MHRGARRVLAALALFALGACVWGDSDPDSDALEGREGLTPQYEATTTSTITSSSGPTTTTAGSVPATTTSAPADGGGAGQARPSATITDPAGDATRATGGQPAWAELTGATLTRFEGYFELRVRLGDAAPTSSGSDDRTMNVATFFDVDGDGFVDYEVWANLADGGWDGSWFDDRTDEALFGDAAGLDVRVEDGDLVVRFSPEHIGKADEFRWSMASEYGAYGILGTAETARDDAPDDDQAVAFPQ